MDDKRKEKLTCSICGNQDVKFSGVLINHHGVVRNFGLCWDCSNQETVNGLNHELYTREKK